MVINFIKKEKMFTLSLIVAILSLFISKPSIELFNKIDFKTLCSLFMLLCVLEGFKQESLFDPFIKLTSKIKYCSLLTLFLVTCVFFTSCFVTNDVSLIIFVPITIILFKQGDKERYIVPTLVLENIAAVRGSLLTPFGSPQNLFLFSKSNLDAYSFMKMMLPLFIFSFILLIIFILFMYRHNLKEAITYNYEYSNSNNTKNKILYLLLFILVIFTIVSRTTYWFYITILLVIILLIFDHKIFKKVDYILILTFLCFFIFSSAITSNEVISNILTKYVSGNEYVWSLCLSQVISNVPASIVLYPFTSNLKALLYGLDSAGLISVIGSLASVINLRLYTNVYKDNSKLFMIEFEKICLLFFIIVNFFQLYLLK